MRNRSISDSSFSASSLACSGASLTLPPTPSTLLPPHLLFPRHTYSSLATPTLPSPPHSSLATPTLPSPHLLFFPPYSSPLLAHSSLPTSSSLVPALTYFRALLTALNLNPYWIIPCFPCSLIFLKTDSTRVPIWTSPSSQSTICPVTMGPSSVLINATI